MPERVQLFIDDFNIENFTSYVIEADIYTADDAFSLDLVNPEVEIKEGHQCKLYINEELELTGIIDRAVKSHDKSGVKLKVEGRDLMGLVVDSYCEEFFDATGLALKGLANRLLKNVPFINRMEILYQQNITGNLKRKADNPILAMLDAAQNFSKVEPGMTVFEVLKEYAASRGMIFMALPDGTFQFGKPKEGGEPIFNLRCKGWPDAGFNNILEGEETRDISKRYSKITITGQQQGMEALGISDINIQATLTDKEFPFYKPYVAQEGSDPRSPELHAKMILEKMRTDGRSLTYKVPGHSQNGRNYAINEICGVQDVILDIDGVFLIYSRKFEKNKQGTFTTLKLAAPGGIR